MFVRDIRRFDELERKLSKDYVFFCIWVLIIFSCKNRKNFVYFKGKSQNRQKKAEKRKILFILGFIDSQIKKDGIVLTELADEGNYEVMPPHELNQLEVCSYCFIIPANYSAINTFAV